MSALSETRPARTGTIEEERSTGVQEIERYNSWGEIFPSPEDADQQYQEFVGDFRAEYISNNSLAAERVEFDPNTQSYTTIFERTSPGHTSIQRLANGNVVIDFVRPEGTTVEEVVPGTGNRNHQYTYETIVRLRDRISRLKSEAQTPIARMELAQVDLYLQGTPATNGWEETCLSSGRFPQRVGYKLFLEDSLKRARELLGEKT